MIIDDLRTSYRDDNELRDAAINQRRGLVGLAGQYGCHCRFGNRLLQSLEASLHLRLHRHDLDRMYPGQDFGDKVILPIVLRGACVEYLPEFARTSDSKSSKEKEQDCREQYNRAANDRNHDQRYGYKRQIDRDQTCRWELEGSVKPLRSRPSRRIASRARTKVQILRSSKHNRWRSRA